MCVCNLFSYIILWIFLDLNVQNHSYSSGANIFFLISNCERNGKCIADISVLAHTDGRQWFQLFEYKKYKNQVERRK